MRRLGDYLRLLTWQAGLSYLALWAITYWTLDAGPQFFGRSGVCVPDTARVLFYWVCEPGSLQGILATLSNVALTATVWAPVYVAASTVQPDAIAIAMPIMLVHVIGLPTALFVLMRLFSTVFAAGKLLSRRAAPAASATRQ